MVGEADGARSVFHFLRLPGARSWRGLRARPLVPLAAPRIAAVLWPRCRSLGPFAATAAAKGLRER